MNEYVVLISKLDEDLPYTSYNNSCALFSTLQKAKKYAKSYAEDDAFGNEEVVSENDGMFLKVVDEEMTVNVCEVSVIPCVVDEFDEPDLDEEKHVKTYADYCLEEVTAGQNVIVNQIADKEWRIIDVEDSTVTDMKVIGKIICFFNMRGERISYWKSIVEYCEAFSVDNEEKWVLSFFPDVEPDEEMFEEVEKDDKERGTVSKYVNHKWIVTGTKAKLIELIYDMDLEDDHYTLEKEDEQ